MIQVFPQFNEEQLRRFSEKYLPILIAHASPSKQQMLALLMACWYVEQAGDRLETALPSWLQAMHYYAKAIQIALFHNDPELKKIDFLGSEVFIRLIQYSLIEKEAFQNKLISLTKVTRDDSEAFQQFELSLRQISHLQRFYLKEEDFNLTRTLYKQAAVVLTKIPSDLEVKFRHCSSLISEELSQNVELPAQWITEKYREALQAFRKAFDRQDVSSLQTIQDIRTYQKEVFQAFKTLFNTLLEDAFVILGPPPSSYSQLKHRPPCSYDIRAMGSVGREEVCPYSDLEFMILVEDANAIDYFKKIVQILEIQVASLGETSTNNPVFTCIHVKNISGFHIDSSPTLNEELIQTPAAMANLQNTPVTDPQTIENTVLKTTSLASTSATLFTDYQTHLQTPMRACREERAFQFFLARSADYKKHWKSPFHPSSGLISIKTHFVEVLNYLLSDMALFCG
ncbi:MAG: DUF294 nucleotidyltransferase-like domain-containing protein, partial [Bacteriovorax sp.]